MSAVEHPARYRLAASAEMLYTDLDIVQRVERLHERGFEVEIWDWSTKPLPALAATGAAFSSMTGYLRGDLTTPEASPTFSRQPRSRCGWRGDQCAPAEPARNGTGARRSPGAPAGGGRLARVGDRDRDPRATGRGGRARGPRVHAGEPEHRRRPPRHSVRPRGRYATARSGCGLAVAPTQPRPVPPRRSARGT